MDRTRRSYLRSARLIYGVDDSSIGDGSPRRRAGLPLLVKMRPEKASPIASTDAKASCCVIL